LLRRKQQERLHAHGVGRIRGELRGRSGGEGARELTVARFAPVKRDFEGVVIVAARGKRSRGSLGAPKGQDALEDCRRLAQSRAANER
jgi:hypothetical protein